jgi:hypothetical protein
VNTNFYGHAVSPYDLLSGAIEPPRAAEALYQILDEMVGRADTIHGDAYNTTSHAYQHNEREPLMKQKKCQSEKKRYDVNKIAPVFPPPVATTLLDGTLV